MVEGVEFSRISTTAGLTTHEASRPVSRVTFSHICIWNQRQILVWVLHSLADVGSWTAVRFI